MPTPERNYEFRKRLRAVHKPNRRDPERTAEPGEAAIGDGWRIVVPRGASELLVAVAKDLQDYLFTSMGVGAQLANDAGDAPSILLTTKALAPSSGGSLTVPRSYRLTARPDSVVVCGCDDRGAAQGAYHIEDLMNLREGPFLPAMDVVREPLFSPRMVHSGWALDRYPDSYLNAIAHAGMDAILIFVTGVNMTTTGYLDINDLVDRAAAYGVDVYLYSYLVSRVHPDDPGAAAFYQGSYGALIESCPGVKGIVFVGESCEFPSKDPKTNGMLHTDPRAKTANDPRPFPGWWPSADFPQWLEMLKPILRKHNPDLDIVFWTYNWGWAPEEDRLALIRRLPQDVTLQATFEMFEDVKKEGIVTRCVDYTASFEGPGRYFASEAKAAHERKLPLYTMSNTGGLTWDIGVIPYEPIPFQWARRHQALREARAEWGLSGLMESHHYGWWPSFVSELAKWAFWSPSPRLECLVQSIATRDFGAKGAPSAVEAWRAWSDAMRDYVPTNEDQYGPFRIGPAYPFLLFDPVEPIPAAPYAHFGREIVAPNYNMHRPEDVDTELRLLERMLERWRQGTAHLEQAVGLAPQSKAEDAARMLNLGRFVERCVLTAIHTKRWWQIRKRLGGSPCPEETRALLDALASIGEQEIENAQATIPLVEADSRLGWEPSMEYMTDRAHLEWKVAQLRRVLDEEIPALRAVRGLPTPSRPA